LLRAHAAYIKEQLSGRPREGRRQAERPDASNHRKMTLWPRSAWRYLGDIGDLSHAQQSGS
jgi:hypothetical protein